MTPVPTISSIDTTLIGLSDYAHNKDLLQSIAMIFSRKTTEHLLSPKLPSFVGERSEFSKLSGDCVSLKHQIHSQTAIDCNPVEQGSGRDARRPQRLPYLLTLE
jgi:hypothetical protein